MPDLLGAILALAAVAAVAVLFAWIGDDTPPPWPPWEDAP
jgi:hypothetical protein